MDMFMKIKATITKIAATRDNVLRIGFLENPPKIYPIINTILATNRILAIINNTNMIINFKVKNRFKTNQKNQT